MDNKIKTFRKQAFDIRKRLIEMHAKARTSHIGSTFSSIEILVSLYYELINLEKDCFILSKGHAVSALYVILASKGLISEECLDQYSCDGGLLHGHPDRLTIPQVYVSTGSLGHGLPIGVGVAFAKKHDREEGNIFVLMSDGEVQEGSVWEAANTAHRFKLDNLVAIIDANKLQGYERTSNIMPIDSFKSKWVSFGWEVKEIDGHNFKEILDALNNIPFEKGKPSIVIAHTIKGRGVKTFEDKLEWHYKSPSIEHLDKYLSELVEV